MRRVIVLGTALVALGTSIGAARADTADRADPIGQSYTSGMVGLARGGYAGGTTDAGVDVRVAWVQGAYQGFAHQQTGWGFAEGSGRELPVTSVLVAYVGETTFELPLTPASVIHDPVTDRYRIDAATERCEVHLTVAEPSDEFGFTAASAGAGDVHVVGAKDSSADPWVAIGTDSAWTGASVFTQSYERRAYSGTVCGTTVAFSGSVVVATLSQLSRS